MMCCFNSLLCLVFNCTMCTVFSCTLRTVFSSAMCTVFSSTMSTVSSSVMCTVLGSTMCTVFRSAICTIFSCTMQWTVSGYPELVHCMTLFHKSRVYWWTFKAFFLEVKSKKYWKLKKMEGVLRKKLSQKVVLRVEKWNWEWNLKGGGWKCHIKYKGLECLTSCLSMQQIYRCQLTAVAWYACNEAIKVRWHMYVCFLLTKEVKKSSPLYLIWYLQPPPLSVPLGHLSLHSTVFNHFALVLQSAHAKRFSVSCVHDFYIQA